jgi:hypothetical protein
MITSARAGTKQPSFLREPNLREAMINVSESQFSEGAPSHKAQRAATTLENKRLQIAVLFSQVYCSAPRQLRSAQ